jgi:phthiocerol/phenolphthiocerol synthesis type-I polyketide synthase C
LIENIAINSCSLFLHKEVKVTNVSDAFTILKSPSRVGKIIISMENVDVRKDLEIEQQEFKLQPKAFYLITGGYGGFGMSTARWLAKKGAKCI